MTTSGPFWGVHPRAGSGRYVVTRRVSDDWPAKVVSSCLTRKGAERVKRRLERRQAAHEEWDAGRGLAPRPGVRFDVLDMRDHPDIDRSPSA